jgi:hypothetical protein
MTHTARDHYRVRASLQRNRSRPLPHHKSMHTCVECSCSAPGELELHVVEEQLVLDIDSRPQTVTRHLIAIEDRDSTHVVAARHNTSTRTKGVVMTAQTAQYMYVGQAARLWGRPGVGNPCTLRAQVVGGTLHRQHPLFGRPTPLMLPTPQFTCCSSRGLPPWCVSRRCRA